MEDTLVALKLKKLNKIRTILVIVSLILAVVSLVLLICFNFVGVVSIKTREGTKYQDGFTYPGWQTIYYGMGEMMIQGYHEFNFDIYTCIVFALPLLTVIICSLMYLKIIHTKGTNKKRAILEFIMAGTLIIGAILLFNVDKFCVLCASSSNEYHNFLEEYLKPALQGDVYFRKTAYPTLLLCLCLLTAAVKIANGAFLLYQRQFARKNPVK